MTPLDAIDRRRAEYLAQARRFHARIGRQLRDDMDAWPPLAEPVEAFLKHFDQGLDYIEQVILAMPDGYFLEPWARPIVRGELSAWKKEWRELAEAIGSGVEFVRGEADTYSGSGMH